MVIVDTNIIIDHLRQSPKKSKLIQVFKDYPEERFGLALVSLQELYEGSSTLKEKAELADAAIAATAIVNQAKLFTLDKKDFVGIEKLQLLPLEKYSLQE